MGHLRFRKQRLRQTKTLLLFNSRNAPRKISYLAFDLPLEHVLAASSLSRGNEGLVDLAFFMLQLKAPEWNVPRYSLR